MEKKRGNQTFGIILILLGLSWACHALDLVHIDIFFKGWWTLILILPCAINFAQRKDRTSNAIGFILGCMLLAWQRGFMPWRYIPTLLIAGVLVIIGVSLLMSDARHHEESTETEDAMNYRAKDRTQGDSKARSYTAESEPWNASEEPKDDKAQSYYTDATSFETCPPKIQAILVGKAVSCLAGAFYGTSIQSVLGNVQLDLRRAKIMQDIYINISSILGGVTIYLPEHVQVVNETQSILGGVTDTRMIMQGMNPNQPTIHLVGTCVLGGLELK